MPSNVACGVTTTVRRGNATVAQYEAGHKPAKVVENPAGAHPQFMLEHNQALGNTISRLDDPANGEIRIYRLK